MHSDAEKWQVVELLADPVALFVLWSVDERVCTTVQDFSIHYVPDVGVERALASLRDRGILTLRDNILVISPVGREALALFKKTESKTSSGTGSTILRNVRHFISWLKLVITRRQVRADEGQVVQHRYPYSGHDSSEIPFDALSTPACGPQAYPQRFVCIFLLSATLCHLWTLFLFLQDPGHFPRYFKHSISYSLIHGTAFSAAIALFSTTLNRAYFSRLSSLGLVWLVFVVLVNLSLVLGVSLYVWMNEVGNSLEPYMLKETWVRTGPGEQSEKVQDYEAMLRSEFMRMPDELVFGNTKELRNGVDNSVRNYQAKLSLYFPAIKPYKARDAKSINQVGPVFWISALLTWYFSVFLAAFYVPAICIAACFKIRLRRLGLRVASANGSDLERRQFAWEWSHNRQLGQVYFNIMCLLILWFPFRLYATYYQRAFLLDMSWVEEFRLFWALFALALIFLVDVLFVRLGKMWHIVILLLEVLAGAGTFLVASYSSGIKVFASKFVERMIDNDVTFAIVYLAVSVTSFAIAFMGTGAFRSGSRFRPTNA